MSSAVTIHKQNTIIAFFNIFSDKLRLEECKDTSEVEYLLHSAVKFIQYGCLQYYDHNNFDFSDAVDFLRQQIQPCFYNVLDPKAAEQGDDVERVKILVALLYVFRLVRTAVFEEWVKLLSLENISEIGEILEYFDSPERWTSADAWPEILWTVSVNKNAYASSPADSPSNAASASGTFVDSTKSFDGLPTPVSNKMHVYDSSPMFEVSESSRSFSTVNINQMRRSVGQVEASLSMEVSHLQKCLAEKNGQLKSTGDELDAFQIRCQKLEEENTILKNQNSRLENKVTEWRARTKEFDILQQQITELVQREAALLDRNNSLLTELDSSIALRRQLSVERDNVLKELDLAKEETSELHQTLSKLSHDFRSEMNNHRETRQMYSKLADDYKVGKTKWKKAAVEQEQDRLNDRRNLERLQELLDEKEKKIVNLEQFISLREAEEQQTKLKEEIVTKTAEISRLQIENKALIDAEKQKKSSRVSLSSASVPQSVKQTSRIPKTRSPALEERRATKSQVNIEGRRLEIDIKAKNEVVDHSYANEVVDHSYANKVVDSFGLNLRKLVFPVLALLFLIVVLLFISCTGDPPLIHQGLILVPWRWSLFLLN